MKKLSFLTLPLLLVPILAACGGGHSGPVVPIKATDTACVPTSTSFVPGPIHFEVSNEGTKPTEVYVYGKGDKIVGEAEHIGPGTKAKLTVDVKAGEYEIACKPGETGNGIRTKITVA